MHQTNNIKKTWPRQTYIDCKLQQILTNTTFVNIRNAENPVFTFLFNVAFVLFHIV